MVLRLCKIYFGDADNFSKNNFEVLTGMFECDHTTFKLLGKLERFILIGKQGELVLPKDMYDEDGNLSHHLVEDEHVMNVKTKSQRGYPTGLVNRGTKQTSDTNAAAKERIDSKQVVGKDASPKTAIFTYIKELVGGAGKNGDGVISQRANRKLQRMMTACVDVAAKDLLHAALEKYALLPLPVASASVECSTDAYGLMNKTVMPMI